MNINMQAIKLKVTNLKRFYLQKVALLQTESVIKMYITKAKAKQLLQLSVY